MSSRGSRARSRTGELPEKLRRELARGTVELAVLSVIGTSRRYGYELMSLLNDLGGGTPAVKEGTLYPLLHRLEDAGQIRSSWDVAGRAQPRKFYELTSVGVAQLAAMRAEWRRLVVGMEQILNAGEEGS